MTKELETKQTLLRRLAVILQNVDDPPNWFGTWVAQFSWSVDELPDYTSVVETSEQKLLYHLQLLDLGSVSHFVQFNKDSKEYIDAAYKYLTLGVANRDALAQIDQLVITYFSKLGNHITKMADFDLKQWIQETDERLKTDVNLLLFDELKNFPTSWTTVYGGSKWGQDGAYHKRQKSLESLELKQFSHQVPDARGHTHPHTHTRSHSDSAIASSSKVPSHSSRVPLELFKGLSHAA
ncbi:hypothetical protein CAUPRSCDRAFT_12352 [Caulochytrium protostelioides]|uniref:Uncharacterized protein n=1 Tax=Caulochytrium protostelioides TaxID=1555241 RepID=A0A4V1IT62_9FUNG|nr:hypothetical protein CAUPRSCDRAFT_12352 [Caulochytrium protostelioides]